MKTQLRPKLTHWLIVGLVFATHGFVLSQEPKYPDCYPITAEDLRRSDAPRFEQYMVQEKLTSIAPVDLNSHPKARRYTTVLHAGAKRGPNFGGHYTVVVWGCGSSCLTFAIINARTGKVIFPYDSCGVSSVHMGHIDVDDFESNAISGCQGLRYRLDSRLLILLGAIDEDEHREGAFYYTIENDELKHVFSVLVKKRRCGW